MLWSKPSPDVGRGVALDIDPRHRGLRDVGVRARASAGCGTSKGEKISDAQAAVVQLRRLVGRRPAPRAARRHDDHASGTGRRRRETTLLDGRRAASSNNGIEGDPVPVRRHPRRLARGGRSARTRDNKELRIYTTTIPTEHRLLHADARPAVPAGVAWQNVGYNQPPHPGFYLGHGMKPPPRANIVTQAK